MSLDVPETPCSLSQKLMTVIPETPDYTILVPETPYTPVIRLQRTSNSEEEEEEEEDDLNIAQLASPELPTLVRSRSHSEIPIRYEVLIFFIIIN